MTTLSDNIKYKCVDVPDKEELLKKDYIHSTLLLMKASGNLNVHTSQLSENIMKCVKNVKMPTNIRISAARGFRKIACNDNVRQSSEFIHLNY